MTLIEMLVAMTITLILIFAMVQLFQSMGDSMTLSRAAMERNGQMRNTLDRFRQDLDLLTVPTEPPVDATAGLGYLEIIEGAVDDATSTTEPETVMGDIDDLIMFTATTRGQPFVGRFNGNTYESQDAEIIWWTVLNDLNNNNTRDVGEYYTLYRRVLLVLPSLNTNAGNTGLSVSNEEDLADYYQSNDVSVHIDTSNGRLVANSLADLSLRQNRFAHLQGQTNWPNLINANVNAGRLVPLAGPRLGEDVVLTEVLAFDLRVFDPRAPVRATAAGNNAIPLLPTDPGWPGGTVVTGYGAYVDLGYTGTNLSHFSRFPYNAQAGRPLITSSFTDGRISFVYDTWTTAYESDGYNQDGDADVDEGANGFDDDNIFGVDSPAEKEAPPPYEYPLRGLQMVLRTSDVPTRQVMQASVSADFSTD